MKDYYAILGLDAEASAESIKVAYRRLATQFHPDRMSGASAEELARSSERMREINEAYSVLRKRGKAQVARAGAGDGGQQAPTVVTERYRATTVRPDSAAVSARPMRRLFSPMAKFSLQEIVWVIVVFFCLQHAISRMEH